MRAGRSVVFADGEVADAEGGVCLTFSGTLEVLRAAAPPPPGADADGTA